MMDERDDLLREIGAALEVEPSTRFEARVLAGVTPVPTPQVAWRWPVVAALGVAVALAVAVVRSPDRAIVTPTVRRPISNDARPEATPESATTARAAAGALVAPVVGDAPVARRVVRRGAPNRRLEFDVLISPDQALLVRELIVAVAEGRVVSPPPNPSTLEPILIAELPAPAPVEIPLTHIEPLADSLGA